MFYRSVIWSNPSKSRRHPDPRHTSSTNCATKIFMADHPSLRLENSLGDGSMPVIPMEEFTFMENKGWSPRNRVTHTHVPSGNDYITVCELENGPVEIVDLPINSMVDLSIVVCKRLPEGIKSAECCSKQWANKQDTSGDLEQIHDTMIPSSNHHSISSSTMFDAHHVCMLDTKIISPKPHEVPFLTPFLMLQSQSNPSLLGFA